MNSHSKSNGGYAKRLALESLVHKKSHISILLIFKKNSPQCQAFSRAAVNLKHACSVLGDARDLSDGYHKLQPDVVIVDCRPGSGINPEECSRIIRRCEEENGHLAVLVAVRPQILTESDSDAMVKLLEAGYDTQFLENTNPVACLSELQSIQHSYLGSRSYAGVCYLLLSILDGISDAVEVMDEHCRIQYINRTSELMSGLDRDEVRGRPYFETLVHNLADNNKMSTLIGDSLQSRSMVMPFASKNGQNTHQLATIVPMLNKSGRLEHLVSIHSNAALLKNSESSSTPTSENKPKTRKESVVRLPSMTIEAPITKVINMITSLQDTCPDDISDSLNKVMDVLRSSELYSPYFNESVKGDKFTSELVGGLMTGDKEDYISRRVSVVKRPSYTSDQLLVSKASFHSTGHSTGSASPEVENLLEGEDKWEFDIISLERLTNKKPLFHLAMRTFQRFEVTEFLQVDDTVMATWLHMIEANYHQTNPYHNSTHAADVMHASAYFLSCDQVKTIFDHIDEVACLIAAIIHDLDHPGKTNSFLVNSNADLAFLYNDLAVLESHHVSLAFRLTLKNPETNIFKNISRDDFKQLRQQIIDMVLATEMTKHFEHLNKFVSVVNQTSLHDPSMSSQDESEAILKLSTLENKTLVKRMLIKCADVSNPARPLHLCREWAVRIAKEYCDQSDEEKLQGLPVVMPMFDSKSCNVPKSQTSFIDLFIKDMYETWTNFCSLSEMRNCLKENYRFWKEQESFNNNQQQQLDT